MGRVLYKDHTIVNTGRRTGSGKSSAGFIPVAVITWKVPDNQRRIMYLLKLRKLYSTVDGASTAALQEAKLWVDRHRIDFER
jgi:hypothetical protein